MSQFELKERHPVMGNALVIPLSPPLAKGAKIAVQINYSTTREGTAIGWLEKDQTAGKRFDYLFSQCQAVSSLSTASPLFP
jgi:leukotriene-A4 hydrolase